MVDWEGGGSCKTAYNCMYTLSVAVFSYQIMFSCTCKCRTVYNVSASKI